MYYVYTIKNRQNSKIYVGQTNNPNRRFASHRYLSLNNPIQPIHLAIAKYGLNNFDFEVVAEAITQDNINWAEIEIIEQYNSRNKKYGYNISKGADVSWNRGLPPNEQPFYGKHHSILTKSKISQSLQGVPHPHSKEQDLKRSKSMMGQKLTSEVTRQKLKLRKNNAKLNWDIVREIRDRFTGGNLTYANLSTEYSVSTKSIENIVKCKTWKE